jgi:hypothetical protein
MRRLIKKLYEQLIRIRIYMITKQIFNVENNCAFFKKKSVICA